MVSLLRRSPLCVGKSLFPSGVGVISFRTAVFLLVGLLSFAWKAGIASAQDKKSVAVLPIEGAPKLKASIEAALKKDYNIVPDAKWNGAAKKLNATGHSTEEIAIVANDQKIDVVITGKVKADKDSGQQKLNIAARHGPSGKPMGKLSFDLKSDKVDAATVTQVESGIGAAVAQALVGPVEEKPVAAPTDEPPPLDPTAKLGKEEDPIAKLAREEAEKRRIEQELLRPKHYPFFDVNVGAVVGFRSFSYNDDPQCYDFEKRIPDPTNPSSRAYVTQYSQTKRGNTPTCPGFATSMAPGVRADLTAYPLALVRASAVKGLGLGVTFDYFFWRDSIYNPGANQVNLATQEWRVEGGLRYHINVMNKRQLPSILFNAQHGAHHFSVAKEAKTYSYEDERFITQTAQGVNDHGLPDILYQYVTIGLGGRIPYYATEKLYFAGLVGVNFHLPLGFGEIAQRFESSSTDNSTVPGESLYKNGGFGPASGWGLRASLTVLEMMIWKGLTVRLSGYYETFRYTFSLGQSLADSKNATGGVTIPTGRDARHLASGATDNYFGGTVTIGYQY
jgi:hypothetical protein